MADLQEAATAFRAAEQAYEQAREQLHAAILDALAAGTTQADVARATGYTRERIRQITRAALPGAMVDASDPDEVALPGGV